MHLNRFPKRLVFMGMLRIPDQSGPHRNGAVCAKPQQTQSTHRRGGRLRPISADVAAASMRTFLTGEWRLSWVTPIEPAAGKHLTVSIFCMDRAECR
jgi:hypothetical protein